MTSPALSYDLEVNALYVGFSGEPITRTVELSLSVYADIDVGGNLVGFEMLNATPELLVSLPRVPDAASLRDLLPSKAA